MSMANIMPKSRSRVTPEIREEDEEPVPISPKSDIIKERSSLADMLYLRCERTYTGGNLY